MPETYFWNDLATDRAYLIGNPVNLLRSLTAKASVRYVGLSLLEGAGHPQQQRSLEMSVPQDGFDLNVTWANLFRTDIGLSGSSNGTRDVNRFFEIVAEVRRGMQEVRNSRRTLLRYSFRMGLGSDVADVALNIFNDPLEGLSLLLFPRLNNGLDLHCNGVPRAIERHLHNAKANATDITGDPLFSAINLTTGDTASLMQHAHGLLESERWRRRSMEWDRGRLVDARAVYRTFDGL